VNLFDTCTNREYNLFLLLMIGCVKKGTLLFIEVYSDSALYAEILFDNFRDLVGVNFP